jgi:hypothetical protein
MNIKDGLTPEAIDEIVAAQMKYWSKKKNHMIIGEEDKELADEVIKAAKIMLDFYGG